MAYEKPWLSMDDQLDLLVRRGLDIGERRHAERLLQQVGYYRLTGYLYPLRVSTTVEDEKGKTRAHVLPEYRPGATLDEVERLLGFDRALRLLVLEGVERIEVAVRTRLGHDLGRISPFAHEDPSSFVAAFTTVDERGTTAHQRWLEKSAARQAASDEAFVAHHRSRYGGRMPIWVLVEILEFGQVARLYAALRNDVATDIALALDVPTERFLQSWLSSLNYVRTVAAHHARLFNRKLVAAPARPRDLDVPALGHLRSRHAPKQNGTYAALAVMAYLLRSVAPDSDRTHRAAALLRSFPSTDVIDVTSVGAHPDWLDLPLWTPRAQDRGRA